MYIAICSLPLESTIDDQGKQIGKEVDNRVNALQHEIDDQGKQIVNVTGEVGKEMLDKK